MDEDVNPLGENTATVDVDGPNGEQTQTAEVKWSGKVGEQLKRDEQCLFQTVGSVHVELSHRNRNRFANFASVLPFSLAQSHDRLFS